MKRGYLLIFLFMPVTAGKCYILCQMSPYLSLVFFKDNYFTSAAHF